MKTYVLALLCALLAGCAPAPSPSFSPSPATTPPTCYRDPVPTPRDPAYLPSSYCPAEEVAVETAVAHLGFPIERIAIAPTVFPCGVPWPAGSPACPPFLELAAFVAFGGTDEVAVLTVALVPTGPVTAKQVAFQVPPAGWSVP